MAGAILLTAMAAGGFSLWLKRRNQQKESERADDVPSDNL